jgi:translation initiation factor 2 beta subunit (eIF-2beta)/eIF-5
MSARQFRDFRAASLYCTPCGQARPVRERLLLVLPEKELYEYLCEECGTAVGTREISAAEQVMRREAARTPRGPQVRIL